ncbi:MAG: family 43 glycosylhydrolase [Lachnospiraceae bacterium]|nr:family 43 glycosylhydrolase [Lachnospiraceae bacterium]
MQEFENCRNPVFPPSICIPDGEAHVFHERLYVYGSYDLLTDGYCSEEYHVASTADMQSWTLHDKSLDGKDIPWPTAKKKKRYYTVDMSLRNPTPQFRKLLSDIHIPIGLIPKFLLPKDINIGSFVPNKNLLYAPDCMKKDGRYYLYFCMGDYTEGVAVSDRPEGPFTNPVQLPCGGIDPAVFTDNDGKSYYYWGQFRACAVPLNNDMVSFDETKIVKNIVTEEEHGFHEGSSMRKRGGIYYYVYPCVYRDRKPTCLAYATSESPLGPFTYRGIIIDNAKCDPRSWNIHGSIEEFDGQWYVFYHRSSRNAQNNRRLCVEKIHFNGDGSIDEVKMTSVGAGKPFALGEEIRGWRACEVDGGAYVDGYDLVMTEDSTAVIRYVDWKKPPQKAVTDADGDGIIEIKADGKPIELAGSGVHEIVLSCRGNTVVHSVRFV